MDHVCNIITLKQTFPQSFDQVGSLAGTYTICTDPSIPPVQHAHCKVPIEYKKLIETALQEMVDLGIIISVTEPTEWVSSLTYPKTQWITAHMFGPLRPQQSHHQGTL